MTGRLALGAMIGAAFLACAGQVALSVVSVDGDAAVEAGAEAAPEPAPREDGGGAPAWHPLVGEVDPTFPVVEIATSLRCNCCRGAAFAVAADDSIRVVSRGGGADGLPVTDCLASLTASGELLFRDVIVGNRNGTGEPLTSPAALLKGRTALGRAPSPRGRRDCDPRRLGARTDRRRGGHAERGGTPRASGRRRRAGPRAVPRRWVSFGGGARRDWPHPRVDACARRWGATLRGPLRLHGAVDVPLPALFAAAAERDGHLVLARMFYPGPKLVVSRLTPEGREDLTFGKGGSVDLPNLSPWNAGRPELAFQSDGKLLVLWKPYLFRIR